MKTVRVSAYLLPIIIAIALLPFFAHAAKSCTSVNDCDYKGSESCPVGKDVCTDMGVCDAAFGPCDPKYGGKSTTFTPDADGAYHSGSGVFQGGGAAEEAPAANFAASNNGKISSGGGKSFATITDSIVSFVDSYVMPLLYMLAFLFFLSGIARYFFLSDEEGKKSGRDYAVWGLLGMVVLFSVWSLVGLLLNIVTKGVI